MQTVSIGYLAQRTGATVSAIRYYEREGLLDCLRTSGNQRRFLKADIRRLSFILISQKMGFSLHRIRQLLDRLPNGRTPTKSDWAKISQMFKNDLDAQIASMKAIRQNLDGCIGCGCLSLDACKLYNPEDKAALEGPGPRFILPK